MLSLFVDRDNQQFASVAHICRMNEEIAGGCGVMSAVNWVDRGPFETKFQKHVSHSFIYVHCNVRSNEQLVAS